MKYTDRKTSSKPSAATVSSDEGSDDSEAEILSSGEEQFSTLTSYDGQKQYRPPDPTKTDAKFGAKKKNPMKSLADELSKVLKKMSEYQAEINRAEQVPRFSEKEVGSSSSRQGQRCNRDGRCTEKIESSKRRQGW